MRGLLPEAATQLVSLRAALVAAEHPRTVLAWLRNSALTRILCETAASGRLPTHAGLATIAASGRGAAQCADHLRAVLVASGTLPARDEHLAAIERHLTRIATLTTGHHGTRNGHPTPCLDDTPVRPPGPLAAVLTRRTDEPRPGWKGNTSGTWLFPGARPGTHRSTGPLARALTEHGIPIRPARTTSLIQLAQDLPSAVLAPFFGLPVVSALQRRRRAGADWSACLAARIER
ncbi:hypothetical protein [Streptomyces lavendulae]|uniref:hypothetical protein n=1 Tax=Streptomyces lavendulae TaxID=1914 RepID=UPI0038225A8A